MEHCPDFVAHELHADGDVFRSSGSGSASTTSQLGAHPSHCTVIPSTRLHLSRRVATPPLSSLPLTAALSFALFTHPSRLPAPPSQPSPYRHLYPLTLISSPLISTHTHQPTHPHLPSPPCTEFTTHPPTHSKLSSSPPLTSPLTLITSPSPLTLITSPLTLITSPASHSIHHFELLTPRLRLVSPAALATFIRREDAADSTGPRGVTLRSPARLFSCCCCCMRLAP